MRPTCWRFQLRCCAMALMNGPETLSAFAFSAMINAGSLAPGLSVMPMAEALSNATPWPVCSDRFAMLVGLVDKMERLIISE